MKKRIIILDDELLISALLKRVVEEEHELEISGMTTDKDEFLNLVENNSFDMALIDISVGGRKGGFDILAKLKDKGINLPSIVLSAHDELDYALPCLKAGAKGYVNKLYICTDLIPALKEVFYGNLFVSGDRGKHIIDQYRLNCLSEVNQ